MSLNMETIILLVKGQITGCVGYNVFKPEGLGFNAIAPVSAEK
jgi:hypothetical protein